MLRQKQFMPSNQSHMQFLSKDYYSVHLKPLFAVWALMWLKQQPKLALISSGWRWSSHDDGEPSVGKQRFKFYRSLFKMMNS